jgi:hypothetical protein
MERRGGCQHLEARLVQGLGVLAGEEGGGGREGWREGGRGQRGKRSLGCFEGGLHTQAHKSGEGGGGREGLLHAKRSSVRLLSTRCEGKGGRHGS